MGLLSDMKPHEGFYLLLPVLDGFLRSSLGSEVVIPYQWQCHLLLEASLAELSCTEASGQHGTAGFGPRGLSSGVPGGLFCVVWVRLTSVFLCIQMHLTHFTSVI